MNAKEARQKALEKNTDEISSQYAQIIILIEKAAAKGEYSLSYYDSIKEDVRKKLTEDGYEVGVTQSHMNELYTKIKW